jgi:low temperature requirement protein LtrA
MLTMYTNQVYHDDLFSSVFYFLATAGLVVMSVTVSYAFDTDPEKNTATIFIVAYMASRMVFFLVGLINIYHMRKFRAHLIRSSIWSLFYILVFVPLLAIPVNGEDYVLTIRHILWGVAGFTTVFSPVLNILLNTKLDNKFAVSIEHATERLGLLVVIGMFN